MNSLTRMAWVPVLAFRLLPVAAQAPSPAPSPDPSPIADNSFLIEEAYNQEAGVVQHISTFARPSGGGAWAYSFTQEWSLHGLRHQLSYTVPLSHQDGPGTGIGDVALNYRYQLLGGEGPAHLAPRLSVILPTGSAERGRGAGGAGVQADVPLSYALGPRLVSHWNAGLTLTPSAQDAAGRSATTIGLNLGASAVWLLRPSFNVLLELVWLRDETVVGEGRTARATSLLLNPGVRWAFDFESGLQIVPGLAYTLGLEPEEADGLFLYLSFEHPY